MVCFSNQKSQFGSILGVLEWKILVYIKTTWSILRPLEIFYGHLVYFVTIRYIIPILVYCIKKNLATLVRRVRSDAALPKLLLLIWFCASKSHFWTV
jgi:hypothetical protein